MRNVANIGFAAILAFGSSAAAVNAASILGQGNDGNIYRVDTSTGVATLFQSLTDFGVAGDDLVNTPNGLGYKRGRAFRTNFNDSGLGNRLFRNDDEIATVPGAAEGDFGVAAADISGDSYYYLTNPGELYRVDNIFGVPSAAVFVADIFEFFDRTLGDIAIRGDDLFVSFGNGEFAQTSLSNPEPVSGGMLTRMAGIAFSGSDLFGFTADKELFSITAGGVGASLGFITGLPDDVILTDAAPTPIPVPAAGVLLITALGGLGLLSRRRAQR